jgi:hypothetical protein
MATPGADRSSFWCDAGLRRLREGILTVAASGKAQAGVGRGYAWLLTRRRYTPVASRPSPNPAASQASKPVNGSDLPAGSWLPDDDVVVVVVVGVVALVAVVDGVGVTVAGVDVVGVAVDGGVVELPELVLLLLWWCDPLSGSMYC